MINKKYLRDDPHESYKYSFNPIVKIFELYLWLTLGLP
jgi:hypothetical protein